jgi:hypothetical protein
VASGRLDPRDGCRPADAGGDGSDLCDGGADEGEYAICHVAHGQQGYGARAQPSVRMFSMA